jgi:hypothetical protein
LMISGLPTRSNRTFSPGEMAERTFIQNVLTNTFSTYNINTTVAIFRCALFDKYWREVEMIAGALLERGLLSGGKDQRAAPAG